jgi:hypothetical protein
METITIDNEDVVIAKLPPQLQSHIALYEHINIQLLEARKQLGMAEMARAASGQQISMAYKEYKESLTKETPAS